jgi:hypothetical protein
MFGKFPEMKHLPIQTPNTAKESASLKLLLFDASRHQT